MSKYTIQNVLESRFPDSAWADYYDLLVTLRDRFGSALTPTSASQLKEFMLSVLKADKDRNQFVIFENDTPVGWFDLRINKGTDAATSGFFTADLLSEDIADGCARSVAAIVLELMQQADCKAVTFMANNPRSIQLAESMEVERLNRLDRYRLYRSRANTETIERWLTETPAANPDLRLELYREIPQKHVHEYVRLFDQYLRDMPSEREDGPMFSLSVDTIRQQEAARREIGSRLYTYALFDEQGQLIGHTNGAINEHNPVDMYQAMTGINKEYRRRGLSKWLKAALYTKVGEELPGNEYLTTDMRALNEPILAVNRQMGFELFSEGFEYSINQEALGALLK
jgi:RimJ/RimL family protein N-acetyltransferase